MGVSQDVNVPFGFRGMWNQGQMNMGFSQMGQKKDPYYKQ